MITGYINLLLLSYSGFYQHFQTTVCSSSVWIYQFESPIILEKKIRIKINPHRKETKITYYEQTGIILSHKIIQQQKISHYYYYLAGFTTAFRLQSVPAVLGY